MYTHVNIICHVPKIGALKFIQYSYAMRNKIKSLEKEEIKATMHLKKTKIWRVIAIQRNHLA